MNQQALQQALGDLNLGEVQYYARVDSTNRIAAEAASRGAPDFSVFIADEQTAGRGRKGRTWVTLPGTSLAVSVILRPEALDCERVPLGRYSGLGALAGSRALEDLYQLAPQLKWPNDILIKGKKIAGVLVEAQWMGDQLESLILGLGMNLLEGSIPVGADFRFPAGSVADAAGTKVDRIAVLRMFLRRLQDLRSRIQGQGFLADWEQRLAYRGKRVKLLVDGDLKAAGMVLGLDGEGGLRLAVSGGKTETFQVGEIELRLVDRSSK